MVLRSRSRFPSASGEHAYDAVSKAFRAMRASPLAMFTKCAKASSANVAFKGPNPRTWSSKARLTMAAIWSSDRLCKVNTRHRESRGAITSKDGFSVVAPLKVIVPSSTWGRINVLLGLVEPVNLVHEEDRRLLVHSLPVLGFSNDFPQVGYARCDSADRSKIGLCCSGHQPSQSGLSGSGRSPEK